LIGLHLLSQAGSSSAERRNMVPIHLERKDFINAQQMEVAVNGGMMQPPDPMDWYRRFRCRQS